MGDLRDCAALILSDAQHPWRIIYHIDGDSDVVVIPDIHATRSRETPATILNYCRERLAFYIHAKRHSMGESTGQRRARWM
jgi:hypothetical protein